MISCRQYVERYCPVAPGKRRKVVLFNLQLDNVENGFFRLPQSSNNAVLLRVLL